MSLLERQFRVFPGVMILDPLEVQDFELGNRIYLPTSELQKYFNSESVSQAPLLFELGNAFSSNWRCPQCTFANGLEVIECRMCSSPCPQSVAFGQEIIDRKAYCGLLSFNAPDGCVIVPQRIMERLFLTEGDSISVKTVDLPKGEKAILQPCSVEWINAASDPSAMRAALENSISQRYPVLTEGDSIFFSYGVNTIEVAIKLVEPNTQYKAICVLETDLDTQIDTSQIQDMISEGQGKIHTAMDFGIPIIDSVEDGEYKYYFIVVDQKHEEEDLIIRLEPLDGDPDVFVDQDEKYPGRHVHQWASCSTGMDEVMIGYEDQHRKSGTFWISVRAYRGSARYKVIATLENRLPARVLPESQVELPTGDSILERPLLRKQKSTGGCVRPEGEEVDVENSMQCENCLRPVPSSVYQRHVLFCSRHNFRCTICSSVVRQADRDAHWHCPICNELSSKDTHTHCELCREALTSSSIEKHMEFVHTPLECYCGASLVMSEMNKHKKESCPKRLVPCSYCEAKVFFNILEEHENQCGSHTTICSICHFRVILRDLAQHESNHANDIPMHGPESKTSEQRQTNQENTVCRACTTICSSSNSVCHVCRTPLNQSISSIWEKRRSSFQRSFSFEEGTPYPLAKPWECPSCTLENTSGTKECVLCGEHRPISDAGSYIEQTERENRRLTGLTSPKSNLRGPLEKRYIANAMEDLKKKADGPTHSVTVALPVRSSTQASKPSQPAQSAQPAQPETNISGTWKCECTMENSNCDDFCLMCGNEKI